MARYAKHKFKDPLGSHFRVYSSISNSHAWKALSHTAQAMYVELGGKLNSTNNGDISAAISDLKLRGWTASATISRALKELLAAGFIAVTRAGRFPAREPTLYRFTHLPTFERRHKGIGEMKATNDFHKFQSVKEAKATIKEAVKEKTEKNRGRQWGKSKDPQKSSVQLLNAMGSRTESIIGSDSEQG